MKFEYKVITYWGNEDTRQTFLNKLGDEGWELVFAQVKDIEFVTYTFKRTKL